MGEIDHKAVWGAGYHAGLKAKTVRSDLISCEIARIVWVNKDQSGRDDLFAVVEQPTAWDSRQHNAIEEKWGMRGSWIGPASNDASVKGLNGRKYADHLRKMFVWWTTIYGLDANVVRRELSKIAEWDAYVENDE